MNLPRRALLIVFSGATLLASGCTTFSDRFHVPGRDPLKHFLGAEDATSQKNWPAAQLPELRAMRTELIPDRNPPPAVPPIGWPPL
ncbi:MAG TPA: hypothetical protein VNE58_17590 [Casimicrobiaceae bacterium]|nr:hypothetical protein [Casimicrobiaceae bacterium]